MSAVERWELSGCKISWLEIGVVSKPDLCADPVWERMERKRQYGERVGRYQAMEPARGTVDQG